MKKWRIVYVIFLVIVAVAIIWGGTCVANRATANLENAVERLATERERLKSESASAQATLEANPDYGQLKVVIRNVKIGPIQVPIEWDEHGNVTKHMEICAGDACPTPTP